MHELFIAAHHCRVEIEELFGILACFPAAGIVLGGEVFGQVEHFQFHVFQGQPVHGAYAGAVNVIQHKHFHGDVQQATDGFRRNLHTLGVGKHHMSVAMEVHIDGIARAGTDHNPAEHVGKSTGTPSLLVHPGFLYIDNGMPFLVGGFHTSGLQGTHHVSVAVDFLVESFRTASSLVPPGKLVVGLAAAVRIGCLAEIRLIFSCPPSVFVFVTKKKNRVRRCGLHFVAGQYAVSIGLFGGNVAFQRIKIEHGAELDAVEGSGHVATVKIGIERTAQQVVSVGIGHGCLLGAFACVFPGAEHGEHLAAQRTELSGCKLALTDAEIHFRLRGGLACPVEESVLVISFNNQVEVFGQPVHRIRKVVFLSCAF